MRAWALDNGIESQSNEWCNKLMVKSQLWLITNNKSLRAPIKTSVIQRALRLTACCSPLPFELLLKVVVTVCLALLTTAIIHHCIMAIGLIGTQDIRYVHLSQQRDLSLSLFLVVLWINCIKQLTTIILITCLLTMIVIVIDSPFIGRSFSGVCVCLYLADGRSWLTGAHWQLKLSQIIFIGSIIISNIIII